MEPEAFAAVGRYLDTEMIRDGGSFAAAFDGGAGGYLLLVRQRSVTDGSTTTVVGYEAPVLIDTDPAKRAAGSSALAGPRAAISWETARAMLEAACPTSDAEDEAKWLGMMTFIIASKGAVPESLRAPRSVSRPSN